MVEIKTAISFDEYNAIVNMVSDNCFPDSAYSASYYELMFRTALITVFAPDYNIPNIDTSNYNEIWYQVTNDEAEEILEKIRQNSIYPCLEKAIENAIEYKIKMLTSGSMSMTDIALSTLVETITKKVEQIDTSMFTKKKIKAVFNAIISTKDGDFAKSFVNALVDNDIISKPNRETRRKNGQRSKTTKTDIKLAPKSEEEESE